MKEVKIFAILVIFTGILYWGVEPFAHSQMHPHVKPADYTFSDLEDPRAGKTGNAGDGQAHVIEGFQCISCHSLTFGKYEEDVKDEDGNILHKKGDDRVYGQSMDMGVMTPDLTSAGLIYDEKFLAAFIANPAHATKVEHKYEDPEGPQHPMPKFDIDYDGQFTSIDAQAVADIVAFLKKAAPETLTNKEVFTEACQRCHGIKYGDFFGGSMTAQSDVTKYMGATPPDLSQHIRSRGAEYLHTFINDPQKHLKGTSMPRVGLTEAAEQQVVAYMEEVGDSSKSQREDLAPKFLGYLVILAIFAWLWKAKIWREVH
jgi:ubiquinol-cytochrome c reductase cytochrome c1 subunit